MTPSKLWTQLFTIVTCNYQDIKVQPMRYVHRIRVYNEIHSKSVELIYNTSLPVLEGLLVWWDNYRHDSLWSFWKTFIKGDENSKRDYCDFIDGSLDLLEHKISPQDLRELIIKMPRSIIMDMIEPISIVSHLSDIKSFIEQRVRSEKEKLLKDQVEIQTHLTEPSKRDIIKSMTQRDAIKQIYQWVVDRDVKLTEFRQLIKLTDK